MTSSAEALAATNRTDATKLRQRRGFAWVFVAAIVIGVALSCWYGGVGGVRWNFEPRNFGVVEPGVLYRSAALTPAATRVVRDQYHIKTIIDLGGFDKDPVGDRVAQRTAEALGMKRFVFHLEGDGTGNPNAYVQALHVIHDPANHPVLVHCSAGAQRTSGCVMLYKDILRGLPIDATYDEAKAFKHNPRKNPRLKPYIDTWRDRIAEAYRTDSAIPGFPPLMPAVRRAETPQSGSSGTASSTPEPSPASSAH